MNDNERTLLRYVVEGDIRKSQQQAKIVLEGLTTVKDKAFKETCLRTLASKSPCVLCLDEIDAIGTRRGGKDDVAKMNRVTIALMQELDRLGNDIILVGTTNRPDTLDDALLRRFTFGHTVRPLCRDDARTLARLFFASVGYSASETEIESLLNDTSQYYTASKITNLCIDHIIDWVASQEVTSCIGKV